MFQGRTLKEGVIKRSLIIAVIGFLAYLALHQDRTLFGKQELLDSGKKADHWQTLTGERRNPERVESVLRRIMEKSKVIALTMAVIQGQQAVSPLSLGVIDAETRKPVDEQTVFRAASLSKPVFAYLVMKLAEEGVIELDKPLYQHLDRPFVEYPEYQDIKRDERYKRITARILLSHRSGFPNWRRMNRDGRLDIKFDPGEKFSYSGEGYRLLQFVLEALTGRNINSLAQEKIFGPLGMARTSFLLEDRFDGHFAVNRDTPLLALIQKTRTVANSAGSLLTNASDYANFLLAVANKKGLKTETFGEMLKPQIRLTSRSLLEAQNIPLGNGESPQLSWALGWGRFISPIGDAIFHIGQEDGCENYAVIFLAQKTGIVVQSVTTNGKSFMADVVSEAIGDTYSPFRWMGYE